MKVRLSPFILFVVLLATFSHVRVAHAQQTPRNVPPNVQRELDQRGLTPEEAMEEAERLGIDLSNPQQAVRQARLLGVPDATIQNLLNAYNRLQLPGRDTLLVPRRDRRPPAVDGLPAVNPATLALPAEGDTFSVLISLTDDVSGVDSLDLWFVGPSRFDTLWADFAERVEGDTLRGIWRGAFFAPTGTTPGVWTLFTRVSDAAGNEAEYDTQATLRILRGTRKEDEELVVEDSLEYFGYSTFRNAPPSFQTGTGAPVSNAYMVGPDDELRLTVWGAAEFQYDLPVDRDGRITVPRAGQFTVAGKRIDELRNEIRDWLSRSYAGLVDDPPTIFMDLTVTRLRPVQVFVLGEVEQPGGYTLPAGATIFSALYATGGPLERGTLRNVQIIRGDRATTVDMYNYLLRGYDPNPVYLQNGDHIFIPPRGKTVAIEGAVRRPAIYELRDDESVEDLVTFAGGLLPEAYTKRFQIQRIVPFTERVDPAVARTVLDLDLVDVLSREEPVPAVDGDHVTIFSILERESLAAQSRIEAAAVSGAVYQPGRYELGGDVRTLRDLIEAADGLTGNAFRDKADLVRLNARLEREIISIDLEQVLRDVPTQNLVLRPQDSLRVYSLNEVQADQTVRISGQILNPGVYELLDGMTIGDLLFRGGGLRDSIFLKDVFLDRADLFRRSRDGKSETIIPFDLRAALSGAGYASERLQPDDEIRVYPAVVEPDLIQDRFVEISGAVKKPGRYRYRDGMTLEDLLLQAEGFEENAYLPAVDVTRTLEDRDGSELARQLKVPLSMSGMLASVSSAAVRDTVDQIFSMARTFSLKHRDRVFVRPDPAFREQQTVTVRGDIAFPGEYTLLNENETIASVIQRAGGVLPTGYLGGGQLLRGGEKVIVDMERAVRGDRNYSIILQEGDEIVIPPQPNTVAVRGNVGNEGLIKYVPGKRVSYYLDRAGGVLDRTETVYLTQASGATYRIRRGLLGRSPVVEEGAEIRVTRKPPKEEGEGVDIGKTITDIAGILSTTLTIIVLGRQALR